MMKFVYRNAFYFCFFNILIINAYKVCKIPNGGAGTCIKINNCQPLYDIYNKKTANEKERLFVQQSLCSSPGNPRIKVCCPDHSIWSDFRINPVMFPDSDLNNVKPKEPPREVNLLIIPNTNLGTKHPDQGLGTRYPDNDLDTRHPNNDLKTTHDHYKMEPACGKDVASSNKITGGNITSIDQYPWLAILEYQGVETGLCGGSLINNRFVLTAAHCIAGSNGKPQYVRLAEYDTKTTPTDYVESDGGGYDEITQERIRIDRTYAHPQYSRARAVNDIGLIKMIRDVKFNDFIKTICLPQINYLPLFNSNTNFTVAGWGTDNGKENTIKLEVDVPYVNLDQCGPTQDRTLYETQICAGGEEGRDSCTGDSGGPLMYEDKDNSLFYVVGVVSYGRKKCGTKGVPAVYTHVYKYRDWINEVLSGRITS